MSTHTATERPQRPPVTDVTDVTRISRDSDAREVALAAYDQLVDLLRRLEPSHWDAPTDCEAWHVADMVRHLVGAAKSHASVLEQVRQQLWGLRHKGEYDGNVMDAFNDLQVRDHAHLSPRELVAELRELAPRAVAGRMRMPGLLRRIEFPLDMGGSTAEGMPTSVRLGHLMDVILTRDVWLHAVDIERATGVEVPRVGHPHARIVQDVVAEWAGRHGQPFELVLTGPAGGRFRQGSGGEQLEHDATEFCRILSGRAAGTGLLSTRILF